MKLSRVQLYLSEAWVFIKRRLCSIYEAGWCSLPSQRQHRHGVKVEAAKHVGAPCCFFSSLFSRILLRLFRRRLRFCLGVGVIAQRRVLLSEGDSTRRLLCVQSSCIRFQSPSQRDRDFWGEDWCRRFLESRGIKALAPDRRWQQL